MSGLYPAIEPHDEGMLDVGDGHAIHWEACGNPQGAPALVLHGGPGSGCSQGARRFFDPDAYRIVLFDQRGCGRSVPHAGDTPAALSANTINHLIADIEKLSHHLQVEDWVIFGHSWGSTLGLAYAERHPHRVRAMVLAGVTNTRRSEIDWLCHGLRRFFPAEWQRFHDAVPFDFRLHDLVEAYRRLLVDPDPAVCARAAADWHEWEAATMATPPSRWSDPRYRLARARIITQYFAHHAWLDEGELLENAGRLKDVPGVMVQGRRDFEAPMQTAWEMAQAWPASDLVVIEDAGHATGGDAMAAAIVAATDRFR